MVHVMLILRAAALIESVKYNPPSKFHPSLLESTLRVPANSTLELAVEFDKSFIRYTEHPPDASRGWDIPPAIFSFFDTAHHRQRRIYSPVLLVDLPTPDFSMPYNVIIMSGTLIALFFGTVFNLLTRKFTWVAVK
jgi:GPI-anchor transamidase subunit T